MTVFGFWLVDLGGFGYGADWLVATYVLFVVSSRSADDRARSEARAPARRAARREGDRATDELRRLLRDPASEVLNIVSTALMLAVLVLMVWRPGSWLGSRA